MASNDLLRPVFMRVCGILFFSFLFGKIRVERYRLTSPERRHSMKNRKLIITIIVAVILILTGIILWKSFFTENKVPRKFPAQPPKKVEKELQEAALQKWGYEFSWAHIDEKGNLIDSPRYYGTYGDCIAVFESTWLCVLSGKQVADSEFSHSSSFVIWIYHDGEFCTIEEAWEQDLLTKEQVALMAEYHKKAEEYIREYYRAQLPE